jgi:hypothetical protein
LFTWHPGEAADEALVHHCDVCRRPTIGHEAKTNKFFCDFSQGVSTSCLLIGGFGHDCGTDYAPGTGEEL